MGLLVIETSSEQFSLAWMEGETVTADFRAEAGRGRNALLFPALEEFLAGRPGRPEEILVGTGPGSYTGVRLGVACAQALAMAFGCPLSGESSLCGLGAEPCRVIGDARRGQVFIAEVTSTGLRRPIPLHAREAAERTLAEMRDRGERVVSIDREPVFAGLESMQPEAPELGRFRLRNGVSGAGPVEPIYLSGPFITRPKKLQRILDT